MKWLLLSLVTSGLALPMAAQTATPAQTPSASANIAPVISTVTISPDTVSDLRLKPFYAATIRMPEAVSSVVVGAPTLFLAEHNEREPELVVVKPITAQPAVSNLLIATKSGQAVSLRLISGGVDTGYSEPVDFELIYKHRSSFLIGGIDATPPEAKKSKPSPYDLAFQEQAKRSSPEWLPVKDSITASLGMVTGGQGDMVVAFSVLNNSQRWIELLPPQVELANPKGKKAKADAGKKPEKEVLADQVAVREFRLSERKLAPGARADGVVRFERPDFKQDQETLQLALATADAVNRPLLIPLPFTAPSSTQLQAER